jgi:uncharacterized protein (TIGR00661 family)
MRLLYACSELGLGHASRTAALGRRLVQRGHQVHFFSGGRAYAVLRKEFEHVYPVTPIAWYENNSGISITTSLINILFPLPVLDSETDKLTVKTSNAQETVHRYYDLRRHIHEINPDAIIADGDLNALRMAQRWKIPDVYITNVIRPSYGFSALLNPGERITERYVRACRQIVIPDNPPPYTVCDYNLGNLQSAGVTDTAEFVGSFFDTAPEAGSEKHVFAPISGPFGTRAKLLNMLMPAFRELGVKAIISLGTPGKQKTVKSGNCIVHSWLSQQERAQAMRDSSVVVCSGGHITCFETIKYAKPTICVPTQPEQLANAAKLRDMGCSRIAKNTRQLVDAVRQIEADYPKFKKNVERLNAASNKQNGLNRAVEIVEEVMRR